ncbi:MAG: cyclic nucleotide-binding domain-containing protein [Rubrivivax sp.]
MSGRRHGRLRDQADPGGCAGGGTAARGGATTPIGLQHQPVTHLRVLVEGMASVVVDGMHVATIRAAGVVGEMSLLTGDGASATVTLTQQAQVFEIDSAELSSLLHSHDDLRADFHQSLGSELVAKVVALRGRAAHSPHADAGTLA